MKYLLQSYYLFVASILIAGCAVRIIAPYDGVTDKKVSDLQEKIVIKFTEWERGVPPIEDEYEFYDEAEATLEILIFRNESIEKSDIIVEMLRKVRENIRIVRELHEQSQLNMEVIGQVRPDIMAQFNAIQRFQMALKRAEEKN